MRSTPLAAALLALLALSASSCGGGSSGGGSGAPEVRVIDAASDASANFDVLVNAVSAITNLGYAQASAFQAVSAGSTSVKFEPTGTTTVTTTASFATQNGFNYSVLAVEGSAGLTSLAVSQSNSAVPVGQARLSFVHAAPAVASLDFFVTSPGVSLPATPSIAPLSYPGDGAALAAPSLEVSGGDYRIRAVADGDTTQTVVFDSGPLTFAAGADLLLALAPVSGSAAQFSLLTTTASSSIYQIADQRISLRAGNFAPAIGTIDAFLDASGTGNSSSTLFAAGLAQDAVSGYQPVLPGAYRASIAATGQTAEEAGSPLTLAASTSVSVFAVGLSGQSAPQNLQLLALRDDLRSPASGMANLRIVALAPDLAAVDVVLLDTANATPTITRRIAVNLAYTGASTYMAMAPGSYTVALVPTGHDLPLLPTSGGSALNLTAGTVVTLALAGCRYPASGICGAATAPLQLVAIQDL